MLLADNCEENTVSIYRYKGKVIKYHDIIGGRSVLSHHTEFQRRGATREQEIAKVGGIKRIRAVFILRSADCDSVDVKLKEGAVVLGLQAAS